MLERWTNSTDISNLRSFCWCLGLAAGEKQTRRVYFNLPYDQSCHILCISVQIYPKLRVYLSLSISLWIRIVFVFWSVSTMEMKSVIDFRNYHERDSYVWLAECVPLKRTHSFYYSHTIHWILWWGHHWWNGRMCGLQIWLIRLNNSLYRLCQHHNCSLLLS